MSYLKDRLQILLLILHNLSELMNLHSSMKSLENIRFWMISEGTENILVYLFSRTPFYGCFYLCGHCSFEITV